MASFDTLERSVEGSRPIELYEFIMGVDSWRFTSAEGDIAFNGFTWEDEPVSRTSPQLSQEQELTNIIVKLPSDNAVPSKFLAIQPASTMTCTIYRIQADQDTPASAVIFEGYVASVNFRDNQAKLKINPFNQMVKREIPRYTYQGLCGHILYDGRCGVLQDSFKHNGLVNALNVNVLTISGLGASAPAGGYIGGFVQTLLGDEQRLILDQSGDDVTLLLPFQQGVLGTTVSAFRGCDHTITTCESAFGNAINYGGSPFVPTSNPFNLVSFTKE